MADHGLIYRRASSGIRHFSNVQYLQRVLVQMFDAGAARRALISFAT
jgi:hypothetical protein